MPIHKATSDTLRTLANDDTDLGRLATAELERRGTLDLAVVVSPHAVDRASRFLVRFWQDEAPNTGIYTWLSLRAEAAYRGSPGQVHDDGLWFVFRILQDGRPMLVTVWEIHTTLMPHGRRPRGIDSKTAKQMRRRRDHE